MISLHQYVLRLGLAREYLQDSLRQNMHQKGYNKFNDHLNRVNYLINDILCSNLIGDEYRNLLRKELNGDILVIEGVADKMGMLPPEHRHKVEVLIESLLEGKDIEISYEHKPDLQHSVS